MNTLMAYDNLIAAGFSDKQARAQIENTDEFVTKQDLKNALSEFKLDLLKWTFGLSFTQFTIMLGLIYAMLNLMKH